MFRRIGALLKRKSRARELGFEFKRAAGFLLPSVIQVGTVAVTLSLPRDDCGSQTAFIDVLLDDCYSLSEFPDGVKTVLDIGGHVGLFAIAARNRWPDALIHSYEPNRALKSHWETHAAQAQFFVFAEAVAERSGMAELIPHEDSVRVRTVEATNGLIKQTAFRDVINRMGDQVDLVKLDCEGAEWAILRDKETWDKVRFLTMEFHLWAGYTLEELKSRLYELGFKVRRLHKTGPDFGMLSAHR